MNAALESIKSVNIKNETVGTITENVAAKSGSARSNVRSVVFVALALWLGLVSFLASQGGFIGKPGSPPLPLFLGFAIPLAVFLAAYFGWSGFRAFILGTDLRLVTAIQAWRWGGIGFLSLYAHGILPWLFAFPAGLGDMAIGVSAPWILLGLIRRPSFAASRRYVTWNILGITDFVLIDSSAAFMSQVHINTCKIQVKYLWIASESCGIVESCR